MTVDRETLAEKIAAVERHLARVAERLPATASELLPMSDAADAVILHLWLATQIVLDIGVAACVARGLGTPKTYGEAFEKLGHAGLIESDLAQRLRRAAGFRNVIAHAYESLDLARVHSAANEGPKDLSAFVRQARGWW